MAEPAGNVLPIYIVVDESASMGRHLDDMADGLRELHDAVLSEPMAAAKIRVSVLGFSDDVQERLSLSDLRKTAEMPDLLARGGTRYGAVFDDLAERIPADLRTLKAHGFLVFRPVVFFLTDGMPNDTAYWRESYDRLIDRGRTPGAPNIIACGIGSADPATIMEVATNPEYAFVTVESMEIGSAIARFSHSLTRSIVQSGRALNTAQPELVVAPPENFRLAIDVI